MKNKITNQRKYMFTALLMFALAMSIFAQNIFRVGDTVTVPDGRAGKIESFKNQEMAKVRFGSGANETQYFMLQDIKKAADPSIITFRVGERVALKETNQEGVIESIVEKGDGAKVKFGPGKYDFKYFFFKDLITPQEAVLARERAQDELKQKPIRAGFEDEAKPFMVMVRSLAHAYSPKFRQDASFRDAPETY